MILTRVDDGVSAGIGGSLYFAKGKSINTDDPAFIAQAEAVGINVLALITQFSADPGWVEGYLPDPSGDVPPPGDPAGVTSEQTE